MWTSTCRALLPKPVPLPQEEQQLRATILQRLSGCVYCGDQPQTNDHFRPIIGDDAMPTGFCNDEWNVVPACFMCNCSKHNKHWRTFMERTTGKAPRPRGVKDVDARIAALEEYDAASERFAQRWHLSDELQRELKQLHGVLTAAMRLQAEGTARLKGLIQEEGKKRTTSTKTPKAPPKRPRPGLCAETN